MLFKTKLGFIFVFLAFILITLYEFRPSLGLRCFKETNPQTKFVKNNQVISKGNGGTPYILPNETTLETFNRKQLTEIFWKYINCLQVLCRKQRRIGSLKDGGKEVCVDELYEPRHPCLVYSFGSNFQFDFETDVIRLYKCEVHTFDPSKPIGRRTIPKGISFHLIGLGNHPHIKVHGWKMETLSSIREQLNHTNRFLDILKIDIEGGEWVALLQMFKSGVLKYVKQLCLEVHYGEYNKTIIIERLGVLKKLHGHGFSIFMRERNLVTIKSLGRTYPLITKVNEISLINTNFKDI